MNDAPAIKLSDVTFGYDRTPAIIDANVTIPPGDFACIIGPNAGGKSTLLKLMLGLLTPAHGAVRVLGAAPVEARSRIGYLSQYTHFDAQFPITVLDVVLMGRLRNDLKFGPYSRRDRQIAEQALLEVQLIGMAKRAFNALSGGQRQRVLIARTLACEPDILMLDEPTSNLDINVEEQLYVLLQQLNERLTIVMVSHDMAFVSKYVKTAVCVNRTVHMHSTDEISGEIIQSLYGREVRMLHHENHAGGYDANQNAAAEPRTGRTVAKPAADHDAKHREDVGE